MMKALPQLIYITTIIFVVNIANAQVQYIDEKNGEEYEITPKTNKRIIKAFLKEQKAKAIEFNSNPTSDFPFRLKNKKGNWTLFHAGREELFMEEESKKYSFQFPTKRMEDRSFTLASRKGKIHLVDMDNRKLETKMNFDEVIVNLKKDTLIGSDENGNYQEHIRSYINGASVKNDRKWGLIEFAYGDDFFYLSRNFLYNSPEEVPPATGFQSYQLEMMEKIREEHDIDLLTALDEHGYYFKGRNKETKRFGIFVGEGMVSDIIPAKYDDIIRHQHPTTFEVWLNGKVGYYNGNYELVLEPKFDDFEFVHLDYTKGCALKRGGKWELYDNYYPEKLVEGNAPTVAALIELWLDR